MDALTYEQMKGAPHDARRRALTVNGEETASINDLGTADLNHDPPHVDLDPPHRDRFLPHVDFETRI